MSPAAIVIGVTLLQFAELLSDVTRTCPAVVTITGQLNVDNIRVDGNVISSQNLNGDIQLSPKGGGR